MTVTIKTGAEIEGMRVAGRLAADILDRIAAEVIPGATTAELDARVHAMIGEAGAISATVGYKGYKHATCISINHVVCHGIPSDKRLKEGDILNIDVTVIVDGWYGDTSRMFVAGPPGRKAERLALTPDAGIWEYRGRSHVHTYSAAMCWAGCSRLAAIASHLGLADRAAYWSDTAHKIQTTLLEQAWSEKRGSFTAGFGLEDLDASALLLPEAGVIEPNDPRFVKTVAAIERELLRGRHVMRYANHDDFGMPEAAFLTCRFWLIDAWWWLGRHEEARELFVDALGYRNRYGLLAEDIDPHNGQLWGNFPQTYSMAGLILTAMRLSRSWEDKYWRG